MKKIVLLQHYYNEIGGVETFLYNFCKQFGNEYDITLVMTWLYEQAKKTGFSGTFEDFKLRYGAYAEAMDP